MRRLQRKKFLNPNFVVGSNIKECRLKAQLSQAKMAEMVNQALMPIGAIALPLQQSEISRLEAGERGLHYLEAWAIARVLNVGWERFLPLVIQPQENHLG